MLFSGSKIQKNEFNRIYRLYFPKLYNYALWLTKNRDASSEIIQTAFIKFWKKPINYNHDKELESWLFTVTRTACMDFFRDCARHTRLRLKYSKNIPISHYDANEERDIWELLDELSEKEKSILYLRFKTGHSFGEIAEILSIQESAVRVCSFRALEKLRTKHEKGLQ